MFPLRPVIFALCSDLRVSNSTSLLRLHFVHPSCLQFAFLFASPNSSSLLRLHFAHPCFHFSFPLASPLRLLFYVSTSTSLSPLCLHFDFSLTFPLRPSLIFALRLPLMFELRFPLRISTSPFPQVCTLLSITLSLRHLLIVYSILPSCLHFHSRFNFAVSKLTHLHIFIWPSCSSPLRYNVLLIVMRYLRVSSHEGLPKQRPKLY